MVVLNEAEINYDHSTGDVIVFSRYNSKEVGKDGNKIIGSISVLLLQNGRTLQSTISTVASAISDTSGQKRETFGQDGKVTAPIQDDCYEAQCQEVDSCKYSVPSSLSLIPLCMPVVFEHNRTSLNRRNDSHSTTCGLEEKMVENETERKSPPDAPSINMVGPSDLFSKDNHLCENLQRENLYGMFENSSANIMAASELTILDSVSGTTILQPTLPPDLMSFESSQFQTEQNSDQSSFYSSQNTADGCWSQNSIAPPGGPASQNTIKTPLNIPKIPIVSRLMKSKLSPCKPSKMTVGQDNIEKMAPVLQISDSGSDSCLFCNEHLETHESIVRHALDHLNSFSDEIFCPVCSMVFKNSEINDLLQHAYSHMGNKLAKKSTESTPPQPVTAAAEENFTLVNSGSSVFEDSSLDRLCEKFTPKSAVSDICHRSLNGSPTLARKEERFGICTSKKIQKVKRRPITKNAVHHTCCTCLKTMSSYKDILKHQKYHGPSNTCPVCNVEFTQRGSFMRHAASHMRTTLFMCQICPSVFTRKDNLKRHIDKHGLYNRPTGKTQRLVKKKPWKFTMYYAQAAQRLKKFGSRLETNSDSAGEVTEEILTPKKEDDGTDFVDMGSESSSHVPENTKVEQTGLDSFQGHFSGSSFSSERESPQNSPEKYMYSESNTDAGNADSLSGEDENVVVQKDVVQKRNLFDDLILSISEDDKQVSEDDSEEKNDFRGLCLPSTSPVCESKGFDKSPSISYSCTDCREAFSKLECLKKHMVISHSEQKQVSFVQVNDDIVEDGPLVDSSDIPDRNPESPENQNMILSETKYTDQEIGNISYENLPEMDAKFSSCSSGRPTPCEIAPQPKKENVVVSNDDMNAVSLHTLIQPSDIKKEPLSNFPDNCNFSYGYHSGIAETTSVSRMSTGSRHLQLEEEASVFSMKQSNEGRAIFRKARKNTQHAQCSYCDVIFTTASEISQHCTVHRDIVLNHFTTCPVCRIELSTRGGLHRHAATHIGLLFSCGYCTAEFSRKDNLKRHVKLNHGADLEIF
ncbi:hypothetical protein ScPMuIL_017988 [Solemya velum]